MLFFSRLIDSFFTSILLFLWMYRASSILMSSVLIVYMRKVIRMHRMASLTLLKLCRIFLRNNI